MHASTRFCRRRPITRAAAALALFTGASAASAQQLSYDGGIQFATGSYGLARVTSSFVFSNGIAMTGHRWRLSGSLPFVIQDGGDVQYSGGGMLPTGGMPGHPESARIGPGGMAGGSGGMMSGSGVSVWDHSGLGDPLVRGEIASLRDHNSGALRLVAVAKVPLSGPASGYGTGEWDFGAGLSSTASTGRNFLFLDATYWSIGRPDSLPLRNSIAYSVAVGRPYTDEGRIALLLSLAGASSLIRGRDAPLSAGVGASYRASSGRVMSTMASLGLSGTAPAVTLGLGWRVPIRD